MTFHMIDTKELARLLLVRPETVRRSVCLKGHYSGIAPVKLPNGKLGWPAAKVEELLQSARQNAEGG